MTTFARQSDTEKQHTPSTAAVTGPAKFSAATPPSSLLTEPAAPAIRQRMTGFDLIRLLAAGLVIYGHSFSLAKEQPPGVLGNPIATIGVKMFFIISGYLITRSWLSDPQPFRYARRRVLRILPGLVCVIVLSMLVLGPTLSSLTVAQYLGQHATWFYSWNIAFYPVYTLPGVFAGNPYPDAINGSLWSLPSEVLMYIITPLVIGRVLHRGGLTLILFTIITTACGLYYVRVAPPATVPVVYGTSIIAFLDVAPYFQFGAVYAMFNLQRFARPWVSVLLLATAALGVGVMADRVDSYVLSEFVLMLLLPFSVISIGNAQFSSLDKTLARTDISYGLYLYGFPIQQIAMMLWGNRIGALGNFAIALPSTIVCAVLSWHFIERRALSLKPRTRPA